MPGLLLLWDRAGFMGLVIPSGFCFFLIIIFLKMIPKITVLNEVEGNKEDISISSVWSAENV